MRKQQLLFFCAIILSPLIYSNITDKGEIFLKGIVEERALKLGEYILESKATVRLAAKKFGVSKSTVHKDVSHRLRNLNPMLYKEVREILETNKQERHLRGGLATRKKYMEISKIKNTDR